MLFAVPLFSSLLDVINVTLCLSVFAIPISGRVDDCLAVWFFNLHLSIPLTINVSFLISKFLFLSFFFCSPPTVWGPSFALCVVDGLLMIGCRVSTQTF